MRNLNWCTIVSMLDEITNAFRRKEHSMKLTRILPILALALALVACGGSPASTSVSAPPPAMEAAPAAPPQAASGGVTALDQGNNAPAEAPAPGAQQDVQRLVIKTADLALQV